MGTDVSPAEMYACFSRCTGLHRQNRPGECIGTWVLLLFYYHEVRTLKETERGREEVCKIMENRITEEKIELAKNAIKSGELTLEQIAKVLDLSLPIVEELARTQAVGA